MGDAGLAAPGTPLEPALKVRLAWAGVLATDTGMRERRWHAAPDGGSVDRTRRMKKSPRTVVRGLLCLRLAVTYFPTDAVSSAPQA
jgi:hypothetical protein